MLGGKTPKSSGMGFDIGGRLLGSDDCRLRSGREFSIRDVDRVARRTAFAPRVASRALRAGSHKPQGTSADGRWISIAPRDGSRAGPTAAGGPLNSRASD